MTTSPEGHVAPSDDFTAAKEIFEKLKDLPGERQERVLRWVAEGLGVALVIGPTDRWVGTTAPLHRIPQVPGGAVAQANVGMPSPSGSHVDIKSFVSQKNPRSDMQFAAVVAYWYRFDAPPAEKRETIDGTLLQEAARLAGRKRTTNPGMTLNNAKNQGYLDKVGRGEFAINSVGENLVAMTLGGEHKESVAPPRIRTRRAPRARKAKPTKPLKR